MQLGKFKTSVLLATMGIALGLCGLDTHTVKAQSASVVCDNDDFHRKQQKFEQHLITTDTPVHICGKVVAVSGKRKTKSGMHGYFYVDTGMGIAIRVVSSLDRMDAPEWPWVKKGDYVEVVGRYYFDSVRRQGIDWTHHGTSYKWPVAGYVVVNGVKYQ